MPVVRKRSQPKDRFVQNGLYVHSSPPRVLNLSSAHIRQIVRSGDIDKLENVVLEGQGKKLLGEYSSNFRTRVYLKSVPQLMSKISLLHDAVNSDRLEELQSLLDEEDDKTKKKLVIAKDEAGVGLLHKAIYYDLKNIAKWLVEKYPHIVNIRDADGRTAYHYTPMCKDATGVQRMLARAGADPHIADNLQRTAKYYMDHNGDLELPSTHKSLSSTRSNRADLNSSVIKKSNIRIWIHHRDLQNLQKVIWEGHGQRLLVEHSNNQRVRRFLEAVPHVMGVIKDIHTDVVKDNLDSLKNRMEPPVSSVVLTGKDVNGLSPLHKAVGLGRREIAEYIMTTCPKSLSLADNEGRTALHYAPLVKDGGYLFDRLIDAGADESHLDNKQKTAAFYKSRTNELDVKLLTVIPDCPRLAKESYLSTYDWNLMGSNVNSAVTPTDLEKRDIVNNNISSNTEDVETTSDKDTTEAEVEEAANGHSNMNGDLNAVEEAKIIVEDSSAVEAEPPSEVVPDEQQLEDEVSTTELEQEIEAEETQTEIETETDTVEPPHEEEEATNNEGEVYATTNELETETEYEIEPSTTEIGEIEPEAENELEPTTTEEEEVTEEQPTEEQPTEEQPTEEQPTEDVNEELNEIIDPDQVEVTEEEYIAKQSTPLHEVKTASSEPEVDSSEGVIEGVVNGENEIESVNEEGQGSGSADDDPDVQKLVESGNMEQLASMVLNGDGDKLIGHHSEIIELQTFLENVPTYMTKIKKIHTAARNGGLKDLQAALDRRKFAIAKDKMSPNGATPLHVACIFGNTSIVRYLAGRFPETIAAVDADGRAPLHYAAVITDNGHYYNLLVHLGANTRADDKYGHTPEFYKSNQGSLSHRSLLRDFGAEELLTDEMLQDKDNAVSSSQVEMPFFCTEEGRYLASSLGDPLIKGLTEVANVRPEDPIAYLAQYLYNFSSHIGSSRSRGMPITQGEADVISEPAINRDAQNGNIQSSVPQSIDVVTVEPEESPEDESAFNATSRDEHGQSMLHFAAARSHGRNALFQLLLETEINIGYRDELYRTARDISIQANIADNTVEIDRYVLQIATKGDTDKLVELLLDGYDHIIDIVDEEGTPIIDAVSNANQPDTVAFIHSILAFEERRERVHHAIREGNLSECMSLLADENDTGSGKLLAIGKNSYGRCALHIAVLCQMEEIVDYLANTFHDCLRIGDNLERTALHYAMGVDKIEMISKVLIKAGAKRVVKDLKGRQPTYYFMNKSDILRLQEEEETF